VNPSHWFLLQHYLVPRNDAFRCFDEMGELVQSEMDLWMREADNDKQETDRIISTVPCFQLDIVVGVSKGTKQVMHFLQYFPLICTIWTQGCSLHRCTSSNFDPDNVLVTRKSNGSISSSGTRGSHFGKSKD
jgi:hypothetical protein